MSPRRVAVLGQGAMGSRMAVRLAGAGHAVTVWNRTPGRDGPALAAGASTAATPAAAVAGADVAISMLRDDAAARATWLEEPDAALPALARGAVALECSTVSPRWTRTLHAACGEAGVLALDAPVVGSRPQAEAGQLVVLAGGEASLVEAVEPVLRAFAGAVHHVGGPGAGAVVKLMANTLFGIQVAALAELLAMARAGGVDAGRAVEVLAATPVLGPAARGAATGMLAGAFAPMFPVDLVAKDFALALDLAAGPVATATRDVLELARARGLGGENLTAIAKLHL